MRMVTTSYHCRNCDVELHPEVLFQPNNPCPQCGQEHPNREFVIRPVAARMLEDNPRSHAGCMAGEVAA